MGIAFYGLENFKELFRSTGFSLPDDESYRDFFKLGFNKWVISQEKQESNSAINAEGNGIYVWTDYRSKSTVSIEIMNYEGGLLNLMENKDYLYLQPVHSLSTFFEQNKWHLLDEFKKQSNKENLLKLQ